eukprot:m.46627 g.46627  ORF g.46627 m.46627 type:complete len:824 (-) comp6787_c0_seq1:233-2704(-)
MFRSVSAKREKAANKPPPTVCVTSADVDVSKSNPRFGGGLATRTGLLTGKAPTQASRAAHEAPATTTAKTPAAPWLHAFGDGARPLAASPTADDGGETNKQHGSASPNLLKTPTKKSRTWSISPKKSITTPTRETRPLSVSPMSFTPPPSQPTVEPCSSPGLKTDGGEWINPVDKAARESAWWTDDRSEALEFERALAGDNVPDGAFVVHPNPDPTLGPSVGLAYRYANDVERVVVQVRRDGLQLEDGLRSTFPTLSNLIDFYSAPSYTGPELKCRLNPAHEIHIPQRKRRASRLKGILTTPAVLGGAGGEVGRPRRSTNGVRFDEDSIRETQGTGTLTRGGVRGCLDAAAAEAAFYLGNILLMDAADILATAQPREFVVYDDLQSSDRLRLSYVKDDQGHVEHTAIECVTSTGVRLASAPSDSKVYRSVSHLIAALCAPSSTILGGPLKMPDLDREFGEPWMHPRATGDQAGFLLLGQPNGTFVVRTGAYDNDAVPVLTYYHQRKIHHVNILRVAKIGKYHLESSTRTFSTVRDLVQFYCRETGGDIEHRLIPPTEAHMHGGLVHRPRWLRLGVSKTEALEEVNFITDGSFVVRSSSHVKGELLLSYALNYTIVTERIVQNVAPGCVTMYALEAVKDARFPSLTALVRHYATPGRGLKCALYVKGMKKSRMSRRGAVAPSRHAPTPSDGASPHKGKTRASMLDDGRASTVATVAEPDHSLAMHPFVDDAATRAKWFCMNCTKAEALARLPGETGSFVFRPNLQYFATLSVVVDGRIFNAHVVEDAAGLFLKGATLSHATLSELVKHYTRSDQIGLPIPLQEW